MGAKKPIGLAGAAAIAGLTLGAVAHAAPNGSQITAGAAVFEENCAACHQSGGIGQPGTAPSLVNPELLRFASNRFLEATILQGREGTAMPPFGEMLKPEEVSAVIAYLRSFGKGRTEGDKTDRDKPAAGDVVNGGKLFADICSTCHGTRGEGYEAEGSGTAIGAPGFLSTASDGFIRATVRYGRSNTKMRGFHGPEGLANLSAKEIDDIITYMRTALNK